jgi:hypothetical protein
MQSLLAIVVIHSTLVRELSGVNQFVASQTLAALSFILSLLSLWSFITYRLEQSNNLRHNNARVVC